MDFRRTIFIGLLSGLIFTACDDADDPVAGYEIPATYSFENVSYAGQTARLAMLQELDLEMKKGNAGTVVEATKLKNMFANENAPFSNAALNADSKELKDKTFVPDHFLFESMMDSVALASTSTVKGQDGVAGIVTSIDGSKQYLLASNGIEYTQVITKALMGATFYYQVAATYLTEERIGNAVDNTTITPGEGTKMEHHWDEAFGYFGVPKDFPANKSGIRFWGSYSDKVDGVIGSNKTLMDAFIKGRAAISNNDMVTKDAQALLIKAEWEKLVAASAIHELNAAKVNFTDDAIRNHLLSEAIGFVMALKYNPDRKITPAEINEILDQIGINLYESSFDGVNNAIDAISDIYGFETIKATL